MREIVTPSLSLRATVINIERVAMRSEQFEKRLQNVRSQLLNHLYVCTYVCPLPSLSLLISPP